MLRNSLWWVLAPVANAGTTGKKNPRFTGEVNNYLQKGWRQSRLGDRPQGMLRLNAEYYTAIDQVHHDGEQHEEMGYRVRQRGCCRIACAELQ